MPKQSFALNCGWHVKNEWRYYKNFTYNGTDILLNWTRSEGRNFFDVNLSLNKFLFGGENTKTYSSKNDYALNIHLRLNVLKELVRRESGVSDLNVFNACFARYDVGLPLAFKDEKTARSALDYIGQGHLPHRPPSKEFIEDSGYYWNNKTAYDLIKVRRNFRTVKELDKIRQPNRTFTAYICEDDRRKVRLETRHYHRDSIQDYCDYRKLKNNLAVLTDFDRMNTIFWNDALPLFSDSDKEFISKNVNFSSVS